MFKKAMHRASPKKQSQDQAATAFSLFSFHFGGMMASYYYVKKLPITTSWCELSRFELLKFFCLHESYNPVYV